MFLLSHQTWCLHSGPIYLQVAVDERQNSSDTSVDTRLASGSTALTPRDKADEDAGASVDDWAAAVALAGVLAASSETSAEHVVSDGRRAIVGSAGRT